MQPAVLRAETGYYQVIAHTSPRHERTLLRGFWTTARMGTTRLWHLPRSFYFPNTLDFARIGGETGSFFWALCSSSFFFVSFWRGQRHCMAPRTSRCGGTCCKSHEKRTLPTCQSRIFHWHRSPVLPSLHRPAEYLTKCPTLLPTARLLDLDLPNPNPEQPILLTEGPAAARPGPSCSNQRARCPLAHSQDGCATTKDRPRRG